MPKVITISEDVYEELKLLKGDRSFSQFFREILRNKKKTASKKQLLEYIRTLEKTVRRSKENLSERINEVLYGAGGS